MQDGFWRYGLPAVGALVSAVALGCSGGGGGSDGREVTTFRGTLANQTALMAPRETGSSLRASLWRLLSPISIAHAQVGGVEVCVEGTTFCTTTDSAGSFTLPADVSGDVTLVFTSDDFTARIALSNVPQGATITIDGIDCSLSTGVCVADDIDVDEPSDVSGEPSDPSDLEASDASEPSPSGIDDVSDVSQPSDPSEPSLPSDPSEPSVSTDASES
jgi:hypothetical protein